MKYKYPRFHLRKNGIHIGRAALAMLGLAVGTATAGEAVSNTEDGYLGELPVVLSVTRLAQTLEDTPGAVTVIDREMIRKSGAREVTDLLRFVPGFIVGHLDNDANPTANYHAMLDTTLGGGGTHMQVFIDGRSIYSSIYSGDTHRGLTGVVLEDVERIEVLRGSNSAAYGSNAFLGVINIITRNTADTHGVLLSYTGGNRGVNDNVARVGWGNDVANFRLTTSRREDAGTTPFLRPSGSYSKAYDDRTVSQIHFRGDVRPGNVDEIAFQLGSTTNSAGIGGGTAGNPYRNEETLASYAQVRWAHDVSAQESISMVAQFDQEEHRDISKANTGFGGPTGDSRRHNIEIQHTRQYSDSVRAVLGAAWRHEMARGRYVFLTEDSQTQLQRRAFGNLEWRPWSDWVLNAGGLFEDHSVTGSSWSPRVMLNYHLTPEHTLRMGSTRANRTPAIFELRSNGYVFSNTTGLPIARIFAPSAGLKPETVHSNELGYLGNMRSLRLQVDARFFREEIRELITTTSISPITSTFINNGSLETRGLEQQWKWHPLDGTQLIFNHTYTQITGSNPNYGTRAPRVSYSSSWFQRLPANLDLSLMYAHVQEMSFGNADKRLPAYGQIDVRLGYPFRMGSTKVEAAITTQAINGSHLEGTRDILITRRTMGTLRLEF